MEDFNTASTNLCLVELTESKVDLVANFATKMSLYKKYMDSMEFGTKLDMLAMLIYLGREIKLQYPLTN